VKGRLVGHGHFLELCPLDNNLHRIKWNLLPFPFSTLLEFEELSLHILLSIITYTFCSNFMFWN